MREELGEEAVPKEEAKTIESMKVADETVIRESDEEEVLGEDNIDEFNKYFKSETEPKIMFTTNRRPKGKFFEFLKELKMTLPNSYYYERKNFPIK